MIKKAIIVIIILLIGWFGYQWIKGEDVTVPTVPTVSSPIEEQLGNLLEDADLQEVPTETEDAGQIIGDKIESTNVGEGK